MQNERKARKNRRRDVVGHRQMRRNAHREQRRLNEKAAAAENGTESLTDKRGNANDEIMQKIHDPNYRALPFANLSNAIKLSSNAGICLSGSMLGPSHGAWSGSGCVSMKIEASPTATAARASTGTNSR